MSSTLDLLQSFLRANLRNYNAIPAIVCADGFKLSVQVGGNPRSLYCSPKDNVGPWTHVEAGYPNHIEPLLWKYVEGGLNGPIDSLDVIYPYTPIEVVAAVIDAHGGMVAKDTVLCGTRNKAAP